MRVTKKSPGRSVLVKKTRAMTKARRTQLIFCAATAGLNVVLMGLSLKHLVTGFATVTGTGIEETWPLAVVVDLAYVVLKIAEQVVDSERVRGKLAVIANTVVYSTVATSALTNALVFSANATGRYWYVAVALGVGISLLNLALTKVATILYVEK